MRGLPAMKGTAARPVGEPDKPRYVAICTGCNTPFDTTSHKAKWCSETCREAHRVAKLTPVAAPPDEWDWRLDAACIGKPEIMLDEDNPEAAQAICATCTVGAPCLEEALARHEVGVRDGTTSNDRVKLTRVRRRTA